MSINATIQTNELTGNIVNSPIEATFVGSINIDVDTLALATSGGAELVGSIQFGTGAVARTVQDKLRELPISVFDFGATGDGVADDSGAILTAATRAVERGKWLELYDHYLASNVELPSGVKIHFKGTISGGGSTYLKFTGSNFRSRGFVGDGAYLFAAYNSSDGLIEDSFGQNSTYTIRYEAGSSRGPRRVHVRGLRHSNVTNGLYVECAEYCQFEKLDGTGSTRPFTVNSGKHNTFRKWIAPADSVVGFLNIANRSITGQAGLLHNLWEDFAILGFSQEGLSFDCRGNESAGSSIQLTTAVSSITSGNTIVPTTDVAAFGAIGRMVTFQTGRLRGTSFLCDYSGATGTGGWRLVGGFSSVSSLVQAGDVISLEIACKGNIVRNGYITGTGTSGHGSGTISAGLGAYGWGHGTRFENVRVEGCDVYAQALRGIINTTDKDYAIPHGIVFDRVEVDAGRKIAVDPFSYLSQPLGYLTGAEIGNCRAGTIYLERALNYRDFGNEGVATKTITDCEDSTDLYVPTRTYGRTKTYRRLVPHNVATDLFKLKLGTAKFARAYRVVTEVFPVGSDSGIFAYDRCVLEGRLIVKRMDATTSVLTASYTALTSSDAASVSGGYITLDASAVALTWAMSGSASIGAADGELTAGATVSATGTGAAAHDYQIVMRLEPLTDD